MTKEEKVIEAKRQFDEIRSFRLGATERDGDGLADRPFDEELLTYRQALRDLPETSTIDLDETGLLTGVVWPDIPLRYYVEPPEQEAERSNT